MELQAFFILLLDRASKIFHKKPTLKRTQRIIWRTTPEKSCGCPATSPSCPAAPSCPRKWILPEISLSILNDTVKTCQNALLRARVFFHPWDLQKESLQWNSLQISLDKTDSGGLPMCADSQKCTRGPGEKGSKPVGEINVVCMITFLAMASKRIQQKQTDKTCWGR